jgi:hypothetical protein
LVIESHRGLAIFDISSIALVTLGSVLISDETLEVPCQVGSRESDEDRLDEVQDVEHKPLIAEEI